MPAKVKEKHLLHLPGVEPESIAWKAIILTIGPQNPHCLISRKYILSMKLVSAAVGMKPMTNTFLYAIS